MNLPTLHHFLARRSFYPLVLCSILACGFLTVRFHLSHTRTYSFLVWNLFLAWIPYLCSLWVDTIHQRSPRRIWRLGVPTALWLVFFPNALYIVTDFIHLRRLASIPLWFDIGMLMTFAWTGCFVAVASLKIMHSVARSLLGALVSWLFVIAATGLSGLGVYIGRFLRWNSWDILLNPHGVLSDLLPRLADPFSRLQTIGVTLMFATFMFVCYITFTSATSGAPARQRL